MGKERGWGRGKGPGKSSVKMLVAFGTSIGNKSVARKLEHREYEDGGAIILKTAAKTIVQIDQYIHTISVRVNYYMCPDIV